MANKSFGVEQVDIFGTGTPTIQSPNDLNINAVNVAISTNVSVGAALTVGAGLTVAGISTFGDNINLPDEKKILIGDSDDMEIYHDSANRSGIRYTNPEFRLLGTTGSSSITLGQSNSSTELSWGERYAVFNNNGSVDLFYNGDKKFETTASGINITGAITVGGSALSIDPSTSDIQGMWTLGGGTGGYTFTGPGQDGSEQNPDLFLVRGQRYRFVNNIGGSHPLEFRNYDNNANYTDGITGSQSGTQDFNVQHDAPSALKYRCTIHTGSMLGNVFIVGGSRGILTSASTLSGSSNSFNGIPSWATKITVVFYQMSTDTTSARALVRLRNSNGTISSGYDSYSVDEDGSDSADDIQNSTGFVIETQSSGHTYNGTMIIEKIDNTKYVSSYSAVRTATGALGTYQQISGNGRLLIASGGIVTGVSLDTSTGSYDSTPSTNYATIYYE